MYEYGVVNIKTNEETIIFGYNWADACRRAGYKVDEWRNIYSTYID